MAKSQLIKDIANGVTSLSVSLKRALIIASDLRNENMKQWIQKELSGYSLDDSLPSYRRLNGVFKVTYYALGKQRKDEPMSIKSLFGENQNNQDIYECRDNIEFIESACSDEKLRKLDAVNLKKDLRRQVDSFFLEIPQKEFSNVVAKVSEKLLSLLLEIDNELGNLDNLDVCPESEEKRNAINNTINNYFGTVIKMGNNNEINKSEIVGGDNNGK